MKQKWAWLGVVALMLLSASLLMQPAGVQAQATATFTATSAATATTVPTATPIATAYPMAQSLTGFAQGVRVGQYGITWSTNGDGLQINGGQGLSINSAAGRQVFHVDGTTGAITTYSTFTPSGAITATSINASGAINAATLGAQTTITGTTVTAATLNATTVVSATALQIGLDTFTGAMHYGVTGAYTSGAAITHGFTTAPISCVVTPSAAMTVSIGTLGATTFTVTTSANGNLLYWMCGK
jgi:hypothetical protein